MPKALSRKLKKKKKLERKQIHDCFSRDLRKVLGEKSWLPYHGEDKYIGKGEGIVCKSESYGCL